MMKVSTSVLFACLFVLLAPTALGWRWKCYKWPCYGGGYGGGYGMGYAGGYGMGYGGGYGMGYGGGFGMGYGGGYGMGYGGGYGMGYGGGWGGRRCRCRHRCWWREIPMGRCPWCKWCKKKIWCCKIKKW